MNTRKSHDVGAYSRQIFESTGQGRYFLNPASTYNKNTCFQGTPESANGHGQYRIFAQNDMVDVESDLRNLVRKDSKDPYAKYPYVRRVYKNEPSLQQCSQVQSLESSYPMLEAPAFKREQSTWALRNESEGFPVDFQHIGRIRSNQYIGVNTRLHARDSHRARQPNVSATKTNKSFLTPKTRSSDFKTYLRDTQTAGLGNGVKSFTAYCSTQKPKL